MAYFPALEPNDRSYNLGAHPMVTQQGWAGGSVRFRTGPQRSGATLTLTFTNLVPSQANAIRTHYATQLSGAVPFQLLTITLTDSRFWTYVEAPEEIQRSGGLVDTIVKLEAIR
jgi:hypothetical protein